ncbi:hypothetical protein C5167_042879 [Papaver somniferum]|uniref:Uncharacterized protein n=1 Tax=Papaver somniferum TaxID=3469 RepID=A0A4Y7L423_PAPSO|nr:hypothetical protein C5167_042879 [Papaver somniferum]
MGHWIELAASEKSLWRCCCHEERELNLVLVAVDFDVAPVVLEGRNLLLPKAEKQSLKIKHMAYDRIGSAICDCATLKGILKH